MRRIPGRTPYLNGTLRRGITANHDLRGCRQELIDGQVSRRTMTLTLLNEAATPVLRWRLSEA